MKIILILWWVIFNASINNIDPPTVLAIIWKESRFVENAKSKTSDYGLMQVHCSKKWSWCRHFDIAKKDLMNPFINVYYGIKVIKEIKKIKKDWLLHYNSGPNKNYKYKHHVLKIRRMFHWAK